MDRKIILICLLTLSAIALLVANFSVPVRADEAVNSKDYQAVTARVQTGGEGLYIVDNRTGLIAVFSYDPSTRSLQQRAVRPVADAFNH